MIPRKYFSGGVQLSDLAMKTNSVMQYTDKAPSGLNNAVVVKANMAMSSNSDQQAEANKEQDLIQQRISLLNAWNSSKTKDKTELINIREDEASMYAKLRRFVNEGKSIELDLSGLNGSDKETFEFLRDRFWAISHVIAEASTIRSPDIGIFTFELLTDAFVFGNNFREDLPIYIKMDRKENELEVFDFDLKSLNTVVDKEAMRASDGILHGKEKGIDHIKSTYAQFGYDTLSRRIEKVGSEVVGTVTRINFAMSTKLIPDELPKGRGINVKDGKIFFNTGSRNLIWIYEDANKNMQIGFKFKDSFDHNLKAEVIGYQQRKKPIVLSEVSLKDAQGDQGVLRGILNFYFHKHPKLPQTDPEMRDAMLQDLLIREYGFTPDENTQPTAWFRYLTADERKLTDIQYEVYFDDQKLEKRFKGWEGSKDYRIIDQKVASVEYNPVYFSKPLSLKPNGEDQFKKALVAFPVVDLAMINITRGDNYRLYGMQIMKAILDQKEVLLNRGTDQYKVEEPFFGTGGFIFKVRDRQTQKEFVLKMLDQFMKETLGISVSDIQIFFMRYGEDQRLQDLFARPIAKDLEDFFDMIGHNHVLMTEFVQGRKFSDISDKEESLRVLLRLIEELAYVHRRGIFHGDINGTNIIVQDSGQPKLIDWDSVRVLGGVYDIKKVKLGMKYKDIFSIGSLLAYIFSPNARIEINGLFHKQTFQNVDIDQRPNTLVEGLEMFTGY